MADQVNCCLHRHRNKKSDLLIKAALKKEICMFRVSGGFFVTGINLTEDLKYICTHPTESLKDLVMSTYPTLLSWVKEQTPGYKLGSLNIIAGDFITESNFVPTVVTLNEKLLKWSSWLQTSMHETQNRKKLRHLSYLKCKCTIGRQWNVLFSLKAALLFGILMHICMFTFISLFMQYIILVSWVGEVVIYTFQWLKQ